MPSLPAENNFADLREVANKLTKSAGDEAIKHLAGVIGSLAYRCDLLEREVERLSRTNKN